MSSVSIICGVPGSGKSTFISKKFKNAYIISPDQIRFEVLQIQFDHAKEEIVWRTVALMYDKILKVSKFHNINIVIDCTNLNIQHRAKWTRPAINYEIPVDCYLFNIKKDVCLKRNKLRKMVVPDDVISKMIANFQPPTYNEGYRNIYIVNEKSVQKLL